jgi:hypothetical protein
MGRNTGERGKGDKDTKEIKERGSRINIPNKSFPLNFNWPFPLVLI